MSDLENPIQNEVKDRILEAAAAKLMTLDLSNWGLEKLPIEIGLLNNLKGLSLRSNKLSEVPSEIALLTDLEWLDLRDNELTSLPVETAQLSKLTWLGLANNNLKELPTELSRLSNLIVLDVRGNSNLAMPPEIVNQWTAPSAILNYVQQIESEGKVLVHEAKLLIVGEAGAGKTTLANKLLNPNYALKEEETTDGINVLCWEYPLNSSETFRVNIWDFGGQEIYHATHQFFLTKRSLYILVTDTRREDTDFYYWLNSISLLSDSSPLLILKNERYDRRRFINELQLRGRFRNLGEILETNLATGRNFDELVTIIKHYLQKLSHVGEQIPRTWVKAREALEMQDSNYISVEEFIEICEGVGFENRDDVLQLGRYLHDIGVCLHFQDDPLLKKIVILKPEWGTSAAYHLLDNIAVINNYGHFSINDLSSIWSNRTHSNMQSELLQLMLKFNLCYKIPGSENDFIAPQLLASEQPTYEFEGTDLLQLRYNYEFLPKGIITKLIVVMHPWIFGQQVVWRTGVVLSKDDSLAEVVEHYDKRELIIKVLGRHKRDLLTIIIYELDKIHAQFPQLKYDQLVPCNCLECRSSAMPHFYKFESLKKRIADRKFKVECDRSYELVSVSRLISDVGLESDISPARLRDILAGHYNEGELRDLVFTLRIPYENLPGESKNDKARELVRYVERHGLTAELRKQIMEERPHLLGSD